MPQIGANLKAGLRKARHEDAARHVFINGGADGHHHHRLYDNNFISTTKYNLITFFPKALFEQYR